MLFGYGPDPLFVWRKALLVPLLRTCLQSSVIVHDFEAAWQSRPSPLLLTTIETADAAVNIAITWTAYSTEQTPFPYFQA